MKSSKQNGHFRSSTKKILICHIKQVWCEPPLFLEGGDWGFWTVIEGGIRSSCKNRGFSIEGCKHCFSLIMHGFCSSSAFYSLSLSFRMCVFLSAPFDTLKSQPGIACKSVVYKKACNIVFFSF